MFELRLVTEICADELSAQIHGEVASLTVDDLVEGTSARKERVWLTLPGCFPSTPSPGV